MAIAPVWAELRATAWATYSLAVVRRRLRHSQVSNVAVPPAPSLGVNVFRGARIVLKLLRATCLERSLIMQRWLADNGEPVDLVIGVSPPSKGFTAHAWLDADGDLASEGYTEIERLPAPAARSTR